ncbi:MAG TPA: hypothetical protein VGR25_04850 [bacterium]|nr:hypothetical protein [bacterium]
MSRLHGAGLLVWTSVALNLLLAGWAGLSGMRGRRILSSPFWAVLLLSLALVGIEAVSGLLLLAGRAVPRTGLHLLYGGLILAAGVVQYGLRPRGFLRARLASGPTFPETRVMALLCFTQAALLMRAWMTGAFGR